MEGVETFTRQGPLGRRRRVRQGEATTPQEPSKIAGSWSFETVLTPGRGAMIMMNMDPLVQVWSPHITARRVKLHFVSTPYYLLQSPLSIVRHFFYLLLPLIFQWSWLVSSIPGRNALLCSALLPHAHAGCHRLLLLLRRRRHFSAGEKCALAKSKNLGQFSPQTTLTGMENENK